ncbi:MAG TPA: hypothetical protein VMT88_09690 [Actinomycetes bacterium]|nr:hypothetical protein [Actinomycetes bacterium]
MARARLRTVLGAITLGAVLIPLTAGSALAEGNGTEVQGPNKMKFEALVGSDNSPSDCSSIGWQNVNKDSPLDTNSRALVSHVCEGDYTDAYTGRSLNINKSVSDVQNLSYDFRTNSIGAGAPRISVIFGNGDVAYLAASTCSNPLAASGDVWSRADFTGAVNNCAFNVSGATGGLYEADGASSAWDVYAAAHPSQVVKYDFLIFDEPGDYLVDRVSLGTNKLYNTSPKRAVSCEMNENVC